MEEICICDDRLGSSLGLVNCGSEKLIGYVSLKPTDRPHDYINVYKA